MTTSETAGTDDGPTDHRPASLSPSEADTARRLAAIRDLGILDRIGDPVLTALTRLAQAITGASAAAVHIFDENYQRRVAASGAPLGDHPAEDSVCRIVVQSGTRIVVSDATTDARFAHSSYVKRSVAPVRFYASVPLTVGGGVAVGTLCTFDSEVREIDERQIERLEDVAAIARAHLELVRLAADLRQAATTDPLTGAVNRAVFDDHLARALARHKRHGTPMTLAVIDIDAFKSINDTYGHQSGDAALCWVAERLRQRLRGDDTLGRLGGDEFALLTEVAEPGQAALEMLCVEIERAPEGCDTRFTVSVGAVLATADDNVESILHRADAAMYAAKRRRGTELA